MMADKNRVLNLIRTIVREKEPEAQIILYGSRARGDYHEGSDWDVIIIVNKPNIEFKERGNLSYEVWDKGLDLGATINAIEYTKKQWDSAPPSLFKHNVLKDAIYL
ncbi:MAG: nucleotidyltransferase domain-containing protein [Bacteroidaceae bacterium]|nr:nucleotidyltransferase domain-containing protein [Bacteroidaceae bacterium]